MLFLFGDGEVWLEKKELIKVHTSQRPKRQDSIPVSLAWNMPRSIATPPLDGMLVHCRVTAQQYVAGTHLYTWVKRDKVE